MNSYGPTLVGSYDYYLIEVLVSEAAKLLKASEYLCLEVVK
jgi:hypothetical protein